MDKHTIVSVTAGLSVALGLVVVDMTFDVNGASWGAAFALAGTAREAARGVRRRRASGAPG